MRINACGWQYYIAVVLPTKLLPECPKMHHILNFKIFLGGVPPDPPTWPLRGYPPSVGLHACNLPFQQPAYVPGITSSKTKCQQQLALHINLGGSKEREMSEGEHIERRTIVISGGLGRHVHQSPRDPHCHGLS